MGYAIRQVAIRQKDGGTEDHQFVSDARGLLQCVQMGMIEFHARGARSDSA